MLADRDTNNQMQKSIAVRTGAADLDTLLQHLLLSWGFTICDPPNNASLLLAGDGVEPLAGQAVIRLTQSRYLGRDSLRRPVQFEELWRMLEHRFHRPPRMHIRMAIDIPALVTVRGRAHTTSLNSLSDMGGRFLHSQELVRDERVTVQMEVSGSRQSYEGSVIFAAANANAGEAAFKIGVVFHGLKKELRDGLRLYLIQRYLETIRAKMAEATFRGGLAEFDLPAALRQAFGV